MKKLILLKTLLATALAAGPLSAKPEHAEKGHGNPHAQQTGKKEAKSGKPQPTSEHYQSGSLYGRNASLSEVQQANLSAAMLRSLLGTQSSALSVGAKPLPPGIAKNLARGKPLPPGIAKQAVPNELLGQLPRVDGHDWVRTGTDLVLISAGTQLIQQVISGVFD